MKLFVTESENLGWRPLEVCGDVLHQLPQANQKVHCLLCVSMCLGLVLSFPITDPDRAPPGVAAGLFLFLLTGHSGKVHLLRLHHLNSVQAAGGGVYSGVDSYLDVVPELKPSLSSRHGGELSESNQVFCIVSFRTSNVSACPMTWSSL